MSMMEIEVFATNEKLAESFTGETYRLEVTQLNAYFNEKSNIYYIARVKSHGGSVRITTNRQDVVILSNCRYDDQCYYSEVFLKTNVTVKPNTKLVCEVSFNFEEDKNAVVAIIDDEDDMTETINE